MSAPKIFRRFLTRNSERSRKNFSATETLINPDELLLKEAFHSAYYLKQLPLLERFSARRAPLNHYLTIGRFKGVNPHPFFDVRWYLSKNPDVAAEPIDPLRHYLTHGWKEGRRPHPTINFEAYFALHPELLLEQVCPLILLTSRCEPVAFAEANAIRKAVRDWPSDYTAGQLYPYLDTKILSERVVAYRKAKGRSNKIAFFTCITGGYDTLRLPEFLSPDIDYILFTDRPTDGYGVFKVRLMDVEENDPTRAARHVKLHPHHHLKDYDLVVWFDANLVLREDLHKQLSRFVGSGLSLAFLPHPINNCLYKEAVVCAQTGKDRPENIVPQMLAYQREGYPANHGLIESNLFAVRPQGPEVHAFFDAWWTELSRGSRRDQLSANYVLWKQGLTYFPFLGEGQNTRTHPAVALLPHGNYDAAHFSALGHSVSRE
ncbi:glycosyltransferase domain-containing protein [Rariglobus hedericola]|uniref:DUF616 domain-containing protein n=1 Tax=Rariglobus hedericola TaxID=2597822 RepID=A0A556QJ34_9BACT|nr:glycosyltransferase domain-containing protein [Rariglobus hedericola]TSJ76663.1 DUF616 domain-containing protein [Rariglobus hedericola]